MGQRDTWQANLMRVVPRKWSTETWWCSLKGHVTPAASVSHADWADSELALATPAGSRLCRCLRCDAWVNYPIPDSANPAAAGSETDSAAPSQTQSAAATDALNPSDLPEPLRGKALDERVVVRLIAIERGLHVVAFVLIAVLLATVQWGIPGVREGAAELVAQWQGIVSESRPGQTLLLDGLQSLSNLTSERVTVLLAALLAYALLEGVEAVYLWRGRRWAEYLTVVATAGLLPLAISALLDKVTIPRLGALALDLLILAYLVYVKRLFGFRGGYRKLQAVNSADVSWPDLHRVAPITPAPVQSKQEGG